MRFVFLVGMICMFGFVSFLFSGLMWVVLAAINFLYAMAANGEPWFTVDFWVLMIASGILLVIYTSFQMWVFSKTEKRSPRMKPVEE